MRFRIEDGWCQEQARMADSEEKKEQKEQEDSPLKYLFTPFILFVPFFPHQKELPVTQELL
jgi:hypothetical protein